MGDFKPVRRPRQARPITTLEEMMFAMHPGSENEPTRHRIRLVGPWDVLRPSDAEVASTEDQVWERVKLPASWRELFGSARGVFRFRRTFHAPTGLEEGDAVWIEVPSSPGEVFEVLLNGTSLPVPDGDPHIRLNITDVLEEFNTLLLSLRRPPDQQKTSGQEESDAGHWQAVNLVIESRDH